MDQLDRLLNAIRQLLGELGRIDGYLNTLVHPNLVAAAFLDDSVGQLLNVWSNFILRTTDVETSGGRFVDMVTIQRFEPKVQLVANAALGLLTLWARTGSCGATACEASTPPASSCLAC